MAGHNCRASGKKEIGRGRRSGNPDVHGQAMDFNGKDLRKYSSAVKRKMAERLLCKMEASIHESALPAPVTEDDRSHPVVQQASLEPVVIPYNRYAEIQRQARILVEYERLAWCFLGPLLTIVLLLLAWALLSPYMVKVDNPPWLHDLLRDVNRLVFLVYETIGSIPIQRGAASFGSFIQNPVVTVSAATGLVGTVLVAMHWIVQPTAIIACPEGLRLRFTFGPFTLHSVIEPWEEFTAVKLKKPKDGGRTDRWQISFDSQERPLSLKLSGFSQSSRESLLECLDRFAPALTVDAEILQAFAPPKKRSYTELWLESLAAPPERENQDNED